jgi:hypothetical protein
MKQIRPKIDLAIAKKVQVFANKYFNGNLTEAVNALLGTALLREASKDEKTNSGA